MEKKKLYWRKLDDQGKIYSLSVNKRDTSIFRLSVVLTGKIEKNILKQAVILALKKYQAFKVKMRKGLFWYYFEENLKEPVIFEENEFPFQKLNTEENNKYLFKVSYFENKINIEYFHTLTDGNNGTEFFKEIICRYIELKYLHTSSEIKEEEIVEDSENSYTKNYKQKHINSYNPPKAYLIKGEELEIGKVGINHFNIDLEQLKKCAKQYDCTLSEYLVSIIVYSIYEANYKPNNGKKPINVCVPINLKKYFPSETISNFVSYMVVSINLKNNQEYNLEDIIKLVKKEFEKKLQIEKVVETMSANGKIVNNIFVRLVPLMLKKVLVVTGSLSVKRQFTTTFSNIGKIEFDNKYKEYIENFFMVMAPDWAEKIRCGVCSYNNQMLVTFGTLLNGSSIEIKFKEFLEKNSIDFNIEGNGVNIITKGE